MNNWPYLKGLMNFRCLEPSKIMLDFWIFLLVERHFTQFVRVPPWVFLRNFFRPFNENISCGKKRTALFQTHNWEKSSFFSIVIRVFARLYANTWQVGHNVTPPVLIELKTGGKLLVCVFSYLNILFWVSPLFAVFYRKTFGEFSETFFSLDVVLVRCVWPHHAPLLSPAPPVHPSLLPVRC